MRVGWVYHDDFLRHDTGRDHPEHAERLAAVVEDLTNAGMLARLQPIPFGTASADDLALVHEPAYVRLVEMACEEGFGFIGGEETRLSRDSHAAARLATGGVLAACDAVMDGTVDRAFCAVRPPGHHAEPYLAKGFCLFNNVAVAAEHLVRRRGLERVAIVDFDVHHGNGTQHMFESRHDVLYISIHERPGTLPFPGSGEEHERGEGRGEGYTLNVPLFAGADDAEYRAAFDEKVLPKLRAFRPEFLLLSAGFDAVRIERVANMRLEPASYEWITRELTAAAETHCGGRLVSVLEGGYDLAALGKSVVAHVTALLGDAPGSAASGGG